MRASRPTRCVSMSFSCSNLHPIPPAAAGFARLLLAAEDGVLPVQRRSFALCARHESLAVVVSVVPTDLIRRQQLHPGYSRLLVRTKRARHLVGDRRKTPQILDDGIGVGFRQGGIGAP